MIILGIETTAHTFGVGIVTSEGKILANTKDSFTTESGGMRPYDVAEHHEKACEEVITKALQAAKIGLQEVDLFSFSQGPGIGQVLRTGAMFARSLSLLAKKPLIGVNHCISHLTIGELLTGAKDPVLLYVSGANTQVIAYDGGKYRVFGETLDQGVGNVLDSLAREMGLGFPGGPKIEQLAKNGKKLIELPYAVKGMDISLGGIFSNVKEKIESKHYTNEDLAYSLQETIFAMLIEVAERAMAHTGKSQLLLGGGVACNSRLQEMARTMCQARNARFFCPPKDVLVDNGAMIAWQGFLEYNAGKRMTLKDTTIQPYQRTDDIQVNWKR